MTCPYCGGRTGDMPNHLDKYKYCRNKHRANLKEQFAGALATYKKRRHERKEVEAFPTEKRYLW